MMIHIYYLKLELLLSEQPEIQVGLSIRKYTRASHELYVKCYLPM